MQEQAQAQAQVSKEPCGVDLNFNPPSKLVDRFMPMMK